MQCFETLVIHSKYFSDPVSTIQLKHNILITIFGLLSSKLYTTLRSTDLFDQKIKPFKVMALGNLIVTL